MAFLFVASQFSARMRLAVAYVLFRARSGRRPSELFSQRSGQHLRSHSQAPSPGFVTSPRWTLGRCPPSPCTSVRYKQVCTVHIWVPFSYRGLAPQARSVTPSAHAHAGRTTNHALRKLRGVPPGKRSV